MSDVNDTRDGHGTTGKRIRQDRHHYWTRVHHDRRFWAAFLLMLAAMCIYVMSDDLAFLPR